MIEKEIHLTAPGSNLKVVVKKATTSDSIFIRQIRTDDNTLLTCMHLRLSEAKEVANALINLADDKHSITTQVSVIK